MRSLAPLLLLLAACGPLELDLVPRPYVPPVLQVEADTPATMAAVQRYAESMGWSVDEVDAQAARIVAHVDQRDATTLQRDTWTFLVQPGRVSVRRRLALGDRDGSGLVSSEVVCEDYAYALEGEHLERIAALLRAPGAPPRVARR